MVAVGAVVRGVTAGAVAAPARLGGVVERAPAQELERAGHDPDRDPGAGQPEITGPNAKPRPNAMPISANDCARFSGGV